MNPAPLLNSTVPRYIVHRYCTLKYIDVFHHLSSSSSGRYLTPLVYILIYRNICIIIISKDIYLIMYLFITFLTLIFLALILSGSRRGCHQNDQNFGEVSVHYTPPQVGQFYCPNYTPG